MTYASNASELSHGTKGCCGLHDWGVASGDGWNTYGLLTQEVLAVVTRAVDHSGRSGIDFEAAIVFSRGTSTFRKLHVVAPDFHVSPPKQRTPPSAPAAFLPTST